MPENDSPTRWTVSDAPAPVSISAMLSSASGGKVLATTWDIVIDAVEAIYEEHADEEGHADYLEAEKFLMEVHMIYWQRGAQDDVREKGGLRDPCDDDVLKTSHNNALLRSTRVLWENIPEAALERIRYNFGLLAGTEKF